MLNTAVDKFKKKVEFYSQRTSEFVRSIGGKIEGMSPLPKAQAQAIRRRAAYCTAFAVLGFLLCFPKVAFAARPFGLALLFAAGHSSTFFAWMGTFAGTIAAGEQVLPNVIILTLSLVCRYAVSDGSIHDFSPSSFGEKLKIRMIMSSIAGSLQGICYIASGNLDFSGIMTLVMLMILTPAACAAFYFAFDKSAHITLHEAGIYVLVYAVISAVASDTLSGLSLALILSITAVFYTGFYAGMLRATLVGLICGLACGDYAVVLAITGLACGALAPFGLGTAVFVAGAVSVGIVIYSSSGGSLVRYVGDVIFAALLFIPLSKSGLLKKVHIFGSQARESYEIFDVAAEKQMEEARRSRMESLSVAFDEVSRECMKLSEQLRNPDTSGVREICDGVFAQTCRKCALSSLCWQKDIDNLESSVDTLSKKLLEKGNLTAEDLPDFLKVRCRYSERLLRELNREMAEQIEDHITRDKSSLFALDYAAIADLLRKSNGSDDFRPDHTLRKRAEEAIRSLGIIFTSVGAWGERCKQICISGIELGSVTVNALAIRDAVSAATGINFGEPEFTFEGDFVCANMKQRQKYKVSASGLFQPRTGESLCGDAVRTFHSDGGYAYAIICDGMGSGREAAAVSDVCATFMEKMLAAGNRREAAIKLLSNYLRSRASECHSTLDLLEIDLYTGQATFVKCGAVPSYVRRGDKTFKIDSNTLPIGVVDDVVPENTPLLMESGDVAVIVSDGIGSGRAAAWLPELIAKGVASRQSVPELAAAIRTRAVIENRALDDVSVAVVKVV